MEIVKDTGTLASVKQSEAFEKDLLHEKTKKLASHRVGSVGAPHMNVIFI